VLPFYILHEPVIVVAAWVIVRWEGPIVGKYLMLVIVSFAGTLGLYEVRVRRFRVTRVVRDEARRGMIRVILGPCRSVQTAN
jgi:glucan biosynthesis protein C